jgi:hypothetical protein
MIHSHLVHASGDPEQNPNQFLICRRPIVETAENPHAQLGWINI